MYLIHILGHRIWLQIKTALDQWRLHLVSSEMLQPYGLTLTVPYLPVYKSTFFSLKIGPKNCHWFIHGSKFSLTYVYLVYQMYLFPENLLSTNLLLSLPKAIDWSCRSHSPPWSQMGQSNGWFTNRNSITPSLMTTTRPQFYIMQDPMENISLTCKQLTFGNTSAGGKAAKTNQWETEPVRREKVCRLASLDQFILVASLLVHVSQMWACSQASIAF